jgi:hypothetical protein
VPVDVNPLVVTIAYSEPRYHTPSDLDLVLAAVTVESIVRRASGTTPAPARPVDAYQRA